MSLPTKTETHLPEIQSSYLFDRIAGHPFKDFIVARAAEIALKNGHAEIEDDDLTAAVWEFNAANEGRKSWAGFFYATGGAFLSTGLGAIIGGYYFVIPAFTFIQLLPFGFLALLGLLLIFAGRFEE